MDMYHRLSDTELFFRDASRSSYNFTLSYDKACVNVVLTYVSKDDGIKMVMMPQFVDREAALYIPWYPHCNVK